MHRWQTSAIVGAAGYTGQETLDRVLGHPELRLVAVGSDSLAGEGAVALDPRLAGAEMPPFVTNAEALATPSRRHDPLPLARGGGRARARRQDGIVVDLSGAHRLHDPDAYERWYGFAHPRPESLGEWVYGLTELVAAKRAG